MDVFSKEKRSSIIVQVLLPYAVRGEQTFFQAFKRAGYAGLLAAPTHESDDPTLNEGGRCIE